MLSKARGRADLAKAKGKAGSTGRLDPSSPDPCPIDLIQPITASGAISVCSSSEDDVPLREVVQRRKQRKLESNNNTRNKRGASRGASPDVLSSDHWDGKGGRATRRQAAKVSSTSESPAKPTEKQGSLAARKRTRRAKKTKGDGGSEQAKFANTGVLDAKDKAQDKAKSVEQQVADQAKVVLAAIAGERADAAAGVPAYPGRIHNAPRETDKLLQMMERLKTNDEIDFLDIM